MTTLYLGSFIISLTLSIMDGMQSEIFNKVTTFNYKYKSIDKLSNDTIFSYLINIIQKKEK